MRTNLASLFLAASALAGCTSYLSAPPSADRIGPQHVGDVDDAAYPWGLHVLAADELGQLNALIYQNEADPKGEGVYTCPMVGNDLNDPSTPRLMGVDDPDFTDCQIRRVIAHLDTSLQAFLDKSTGPGPFPARCGDQDKLTLMLFLHGGLNPTTGSLDRARVDTERALADCVFPIFLNWEAGPITSYLDQITFIRGGQRINTEFPENARTVDQNLGAINLLRAAFFPLYLIADVVEAVARAPIAWTTQGLASASQLRGLGGIVDPSGDITLKDCENTYLYFCDQDAPEPEPQPKVDALWSSINKNNNVYIEGKAELKPDFAGSIVPVALSPFRLVSTPLVDSMGETIWNNLLRTTFATFETDKDYLYERNASLHHGPNGKRFDRSQLDCKALAEFEGRGMVAEREHKPDGAFFRFAEALQHFLCKKTNGQLNREHIKVNLVAHSMGAIIGNEMIDSIDLNYDNIVYLAAASSIRHFASTVVPYIERRQAKTKELDEPEGQFDGAQPDRGVRFYNLMLHPWREAREARLYGIAPAGSLLVWIDSMYEHSDSAYDRTLGQWDNVRQAKWLLPENAQRRMFFKVFGETEHRPETHGSFGAVFCNQDDELHYAYWDEASWGHQDLFENGYRPIRSVACQ